MACELCHRATEQTTYKLENNYTKEVLHCCESYRSHNKFSNLGIWQRDRELLGNLILETSGIWLQNFHRTWKIDSWRAQTKPCLHQDPREGSSDLTRDWPRLAWECPGRGVGQWPAAGSGALSVAVPTRDLLRDVAIFFITSTIVWSQVKQ